MELWRAKLAEGDSAGAWDLFIARYRQLILAVIRRTVPDDDDVDDVFGEVCADLGCDDLVRLVRHKDAGKARFSTWLVAVVQNRTIDWMRQRDGRRRVVVPSGLSVLQQEIFDRIVRERRSHAEAYEIIRARPGSDISFPAFMREVSATFQALEQKSGQPVARYFPGKPTQFEQAELDPQAVVINSETQATLNKALEALLPDERLAVKLFVVDELPAADVARMVGWQNAKSVYNRVYRALAHLRLELGRLGLERGQD